MKVTGRKTSSAYEIYGFIPNVENGKHSATCKSCNRVLQNTAAVRLQKHRNSCLATRYINGDPAISSINQIQKRSIPMTIVAVPQNESIISNVKTEITEQHNMDFNDANVYDNVNDNTTYEETLEKLHDSAPSRKYSTKKDKTDDKLKAKIQYLKEKSKYYISEMNNLKFENTLMVLKVKKLKLEIRQLELYN